MLFSALQVGFQGCSKLFLALLLFGYFGGVHGVKSCGLGTTCQGGCADGRAVASVRAKRVTPKFGHAAVAQW